MQYAIWFVLALIAAVSIVIAGLRKRPATRPAKPTGLGWSTFGLGIAAILTVFPMGFAPMSLIFAGVGLVTGALAWNRHDTHRWTIVGQCIVALPTAFWIFFIIGEFTFPH